MVHSVGWETPLERICHQCDRILDNRHYRTAGSRGMFVHDSVPSDAPGLPQHTEDMSALALHAPSPTRGSKKANVFPIVRWVAAPADATDTRTTTPPTRGSPHQDAGSTVLRPDIMQACRGAQPRASLGPRSPGHGQKNHRSQHGPLLASRCSPRGSPRRSERRDPSQHAGPYERDGLPTPRSEQPGCRRRRKGTMPLRQQSRDGFVGFVRGSALHVMRFLENLIQVLLILNELPSCYSPRAFHGYHYRMRLSGGTRTNSVHVQNTMNTAPAHPSFSVLSLVKALSTLLAPSPGVIPDALVNNL